MSGIAEEIRETLEHWDKIGYMPQWQVDDDAMAINAILFSNAPTWLRSLLEERGMHIQLFERLHADVNKFSEMIGVDPGETTLEEKATAYMQTLERITKERDFYKEERDRCERLERKAHEQLREAREELEQVKKDMIRFIKNYFREFFIEPAKNPFTWIVFGYTIFWFWMGYLAGH